MTENRSDRLAFDYREMMKIQNRPYLSWIAIKGDLPCAEEYLLHIKLRTYALSAHRGSYTVGVIRDCIVKVTLWDSYPKVAPYIKMISIPPVFHPCWYSKGVYCPTKPWRADRSLKEHLTEMLETLRYAPSYIEKDAPANYKALDWYLKNRDDTSLFPSDTAQISENSPEVTAALEKAAMSFDEIIDRWDNRSDTIRP